MTQRYFSTDDAQLFGVYHQARGDARKPAHAVVICPPIGQEFIRTHMTLRRMAKQLARMGIHVLRFDYQGTGDSQGELVDIDSIDTWRGNILAAVKHLKHETAANRFLCWV